MLPLVGSRFRRKSPASIPWITPGGNTLESTMLCRVEDEAHSSNLSSKCSKWFLNALGARVEGSLSDRSVLSSFPLSTDRELLGQSSFEMFPAARRIPWTEYHNRSMLWDLRAFSRSYDAIIPNLHCFSISIRNASLST